MKKLNIFIIIIILFLNFSLVSAEEPKKILADTLTKNIYDIDSAMPNQVDFVYEYVTNRIYKVYCTETRVVNIQFQPGEEILYIGGADSVQWVVDKELSGSGQSQQFHVFIKPIKPNISTNLIVTTNKRIYHLELIAGEIYSPIIRWYYPSEDKLAFLRLVDTPQETLVQEQSNDIENLIVDELNFDYLVSGNDYPWKPLLAFDNGIKTYIQMPKTMKTSEAPALFVKNENDLALVNYRVKDDYYIVDRLAEAFEMRVGKNIIKITKENRR